MAPTPGIRLAFCVLLAISTAPDLTRAWRRSATGWATGELARRAAVARQAHLATLPTPAYVDPRRVLFAEGRHAPWVIGIADTARFVEDTQTYQWFPAPDRPCDPIDLVECDAREGWLFVTSTGGIFRSPVADGPLTRIGTVPNLLRVAHESEGRLVLEDEHRQLWTTDGSAAPTRLGLADAMTASFVDAHHGAAIANGGALFVTDDAGASWHRRDLGGRVARKLLLGATGLVALLSDGGSEVLQQRVLAFPLVVAREPGGMAEIAGAIAQTHFEIAPAGAACPEPPHGAPPPADALSDLGQFGPLGGFGPRRFGVRPPTSDADVWQLPSFTLVDAQYTSRFADGRPPSAYPNETLIRHVPMGTSRDQAHVATTGAPGPIAVQLTGAQPDHQTMHFHWRGLDARGLAYVGEAAVPLRPNEPRWPALGLIATTPQGALLAVSDALESDGDDLVTGLLWVHGHAITPVPLGTDFARTVAAVMTDDGGVVTLLRGGTGRDVRVTRASGSAVLTRFAAFDSDLLIAQRIAPDGRVLASRTLAFSASDDRFVGLAETDADGWMIVRATGTDQRLTAYAVASDATRALPLPAPDAVRPCSTETRVRSRFRIHAFPHAFSEGTAITIGPGMDAPEYAQATHLVLDQAASDGTGLCIRAIDASGEIDDYSRHDQDDDSNDPHYEPRRAVRLLANGRGFTGQSDTGFAIFSVNAKLEEYTESTE